MTLLDAIASKAMILMSDFEGQGLANLAWSWSTLVVQHPPLIYSIAAPALPRLPEFAFQNIANLAWSFAVCEISHLPLFDSISAEAINRICSFTFLNGGRKELLNSAMFVLSVAWSFAFLELMTDNIFVRFEQAIRNISKEVDRRLMGRGNESLEMGTKMNSDITWIHTRQGIKPFLDLDLRGMVVIYKPTDWEVDGLSVENELHPPLSAYIQSVFPQSFPLVYDAEHNYGFLHRLDIPSSGLVLSGTTFEGYYVLRLQLDTQRLRREYVVLGRGLAASSLEEIVARVDVAPDPSQRKSITDNGKPSKTLVHVGAHLVGRSDLEEGTACIVAIRIFTGRRHQIRVHLRFSGIPSIVDGRYTAREVTVPGHLAAASLLSLASALDAADNSSIDAKPPARRPLRMFTYH
jgi:23S rRNA-/tRNA-specific pseudouridylate synthase